MIVCGFLAIGVCWMLYLVLLSPLQPLLGKSIAMSQNNDQHIHAKPDLSWEGLAWPWGSSVAVLGSGSTSIQLSIFCFTAVTGLPSWQIYLSACQSRRHKRWGFNLWVRKLPWSRKWQPIQYYCLENSMDRGLWWATVYGVSKSWTGLSERMCNTLWLLLAADTCLKGK